MNDTVATKNDLKKLATKTELKQVEKNVRGEILRVEERLENVEERLGKVEVRLENVEVKMDTMDTKLDKLQNTLNLNLLHTQHKPRKAS